MHLRNIFICINAYEYKDKAESNKNDIWCSIEVLMACVSFLAWFQNDMRVITLIQSDLNFFCIQNLYREFFNCSI